MTIPSTRTDNKLFPEFWQSYENVCMRKHANTHSTENKVKVF